MKPFQFKEKTSQIRIVQEPKLKKKKLTFDRLTYIGVIVAIAFVALKFTYKSVNIMNGNGRIVFEKLSVNFTDDIRLKKVLIEEGDSIKAGDTLFIYELEDNIANNVNLSMQRAETQSTFGSKALDIKRDILSKEAELKGLQMLLKQQQAIYEEKVKLVLLEVESSGSLDALKLEQQKTKTQIEILKTEIEQLKKLKGSFRRIGNALAGAYAPQDEVLPFIAPVNGLSGQVNFEDNEVCYREQEMLTVHDPDKVEIQAFFNQKYMDYLTDNQLIKVEFPDGTVSKGRIQQSFISTYAVPEEFQKKYEPTTRNIVVSIVPDNKADEDLWRKFYLMEVKLTIFRYGIGF